ncbi:MAG: DNA polymerase III subunit delta' [Candidatus Binatia bacterium]
MPRQSLVGFAAICGHERVREYLRAAAKDGRLPHAQLFAGPDGVGKRSVALALAGWLLCDEQGDDACGRCSSCHQVAAGSHPDFRMVAVAPGKKETGVARVRDVKRFVQLRPVRGKAKVVILDDAQMLTVAAQNALLKTLEEPPVRSLLILVANNPGALLPTVRSRCQRIQFSPLHEEAVVEILTQRLHLDAAVARRVAALADGSPGRALILSRCCGGRSPGELLPQLAGLDGARYARLMELSGELGHPEEDVAVKLEMLLGQYRDDALRSIEAGQLGRGDAAVSWLTTRPALRSIVRCTDAVHNAASAIRHSNPNRQLLLEALLLRLARS